MAGTQTGLLSNFFPSILFCYHVLNHVWGTTLLVQGRFGFALGLYLTLFGASVYILMRQNTNTRYLAVTIAMFIFTTAVTLLTFLDTLLTPVATSTIGEKGDLDFLCTGPGSTLPRREVLTVDLIAPIQVTMSAANMAVADGLLIYRCWILWGSKKRIAMPLTIVLLAMTVCNMATVGYESSYYVSAKDSTGLSGLAAQGAILQMASRFTNAATILSLVLTIVTTTLIAVRIWIVTRSIQETMGRGAGTKYRTVIAIVVESGALYTVCLILDIVATYKFAFSVTIFAVALNFMMPIAPTLVIVRVGMGKGFESVQDSAHGSNPRHMASRRNADGRTTTVSGMHFRTVQEPESETSSIAEADNATQNTNKPPSAVDVHKEGRPVDDVGDVV